MTVTKIARLRGEILKTGAEAAGRVRGRAAGRR